MKPKQRGWKEGVLTKDLMSYGRARYGTGVPEHKTGDTVRYKKFKRLPDEDGRVYGSKYEYHYVDLDNMKLVRSDKLWVEQ